MRTERYCKCCERKTGHYKRVDLLGSGEWSGALERTFCFCLSLGASEAMAERYVECEECGKVSRP